MSGVPASTIKHYIREGLLPDGAVRASRNSALYDPSLVERIALIKEMQRTHFLPLWRIKEVLQGKRGQEIATVEAAVDRVIDAGKADRAVGRADLLAQGIRPAELQELERQGLVGEAEFLTGAELALAESIVEAHRTGLTGNLDTVNVIREYVDAVRALVKAELGIFSDVVPGAREELAPLTEKALEVSEAIVLSMRQRVLLQELASMESLPRRPAT